MERVSPLYDILRHLPPFEDGWMPNPVTSPSFPLPTTKALKNDSASYGEFKIELSKDEEHVVSESGRQFQENSALNWYYSAESYSSVNHFNSSNSHTPTVQISSPKSVTTRRLDENHVVSHVPSLRGERGAFVDFNLLESSTTPRIDITLPPKIEDPKPNITTRYILLQSGRIVAINVTSVSSVYKPTSSSGSNKNSALPTFYFGSRIRNKNNTKTADNVTHQKQKVLTTPKSLKFEATTEAINKHNTDNLGFYPMKKLPITTTRPRITTIKTQITTTKPRTTTTTRPATTTTRPTTTTKLPTTTTKRPTTTTNRPTTTTKPPTTTKTAPEIATVKRLAKIYSTNSVTIKPGVEYVKVKQTKPFSTRTTPAILKDVTTLDPAQKWWNDMKAAKKERIVASSTTIKPKVITVSSRNILDTLVEALQPPTVEDPFSVNTFESIKKQTSETLTPTTTELTITGRNVRHRMLETNFQFSTTSTLKPFSGSDFTVDANRGTRTWPTQGHKIFNPWTTTTQATSTNKFRNAIPTTTSEEDLDILEPSVPLSEVRHDFVRLVTLSPPVLPSPETTSISPISAKEEKDPSRRPRYRGLSHVNLQAPKQEAIKTSAVPPSETVSIHPKQQLTTVSFRRPTSQQLQQQQNTASPRNLINSPLSPLLTTPSPHRSRPGFYLRNSVSFQTIPPGSLTDRRTLSTEAPVPPITTVRRLQPPLEDLLIISFEPTRKTLGMKIVEKFTDDSPIEEEKTKNYRNPTKNTSPILEVSRKHNKTPTSTSKPLRIQTEKSIIDVWSHDRTQSQFDNGNRVGRNFRPSNPRSQNVVDKIESTSPGSTTKQPFRVYFFEPKRKKTKNTETDLKNEAPENTENNQPGINTRNYHQGGNIRNNPGGNARNNPPNTNTRQYSAAGNTRNFPQSGNTRDNSPVVNTRFVPPAQNTRYQSPPENTFTNNRQIEGAITGRTHSTTNRGSTSVTSRGRNVFANENSYDSRQPKQLHLTPAFSTTEASTTPKPSSRRQKSSPFIWHRPNVGTAKSLPPEDGLLHVTPHDTTDGANSGTHNDGNFRQGNVYRTG